MNKNINKNSYTFSSNEVKVINFFKVLYKNSTKSNLPTLSNCRYWLSDLVQEQYNCDYDSLINDSDKSVMENLFLYIGEWHCLKPFVDNDAPKKYVKLWDLLNNQKIIEFEGAIND